MPLQVVYIVVRGHEVQKDSPAATGLTLPSGFTVPANARLQLQRVTTTATCMRSLLVDCNDLS